MHIKLIVRFFYSYHSIVLLIAHFFSSNDVQKGSITVWTTPSIIVASLIESFELQVHMLYRNRMDSISRYVWWTMVNEHTHSDKYNTNKQDCVDCKYTQPVVRRLKNIFKHLNFTSICILYLVYAKRLYARFKRQHFKYFHIYLH